MDQEFLHKDLTHSIIGAAMAVHRELGSGFLEKVYENALCVELRGRGLQFEQQRPIPVHYAGEEVGHYFADLLVDNAVIGEVKHASAIANEHVAQTLHYLKATGLKVALIANFGASSLEHKRLIK